MERHAVVTAPVANLRKEPVEGPSSYARDELQESQLLFNEALLIKDEVSDWYYVEAKEQLKFTREKGWQGYPGWVPKKHAREVASPFAFNGVISGAFTAIYENPTCEVTPLLPLSLGTRLLINGEEREFYRISVNDRTNGWVPKKSVQRTGRGQPDQPPGHQAVVAARLFLGVPYLWGGRSMPLPGACSTIGGVDCSGLINLVFRAAGIDVPRDARDQWTAGHDIDGSDLEEGDLIFVCRETETDHVRHVMLSLSGEQFIEASETGDVVHVATFMGRFGVDLVRLARTRFSVDERKLSFRRIEKNGKW